MTDRELYEAYKRDVYRMCFYLLRNGPDAEDACQDVFVQAFRHDRSGVDHPRAWLMRIAVNTCRNLSRRNRMRQWKQSLLTAWEKPGQAAASAQQAAERNESASELARLLGKLPEKLRAAVILKYVHDMKVAEIALALDIPEGTAKSRIHNGLRRLRRIMEEESSYPIKGGTVRE